MAEIIKNASCMLNRVCYCLV